MILLPHMLAGAALANLWPNNYWVILLALISHFLMDVIPHWEYLDIGFSIKKAIPKIVLDLFVGLLLVYFSAGFSWWVLMSVFFSLLPDGFILLYALRKSSRYLRVYFDFNHYWHFILWSAEKQKQMWFGWKILSQAAVIVISIIIILFVIPA